MTHATDPHQHGAEGGREAGRERRPNVVIILADDLGYSDIGSYGGEIRTPHLDRLADEGTRLTQFYNTARCSPSRASLLTGVHPHQTGIGILTGGDGPTGYPGDLNRDAATVAETVQAGGYSTAITGKWHLALDEVHPGDAWPTRRGFDEFYGTMNGCGSYYDPPTLIRGEEPAGHEARREDYYHTDALADEAVAYIDRRADGDDPFLLYVPFTAPHWPLHAPEEAVQECAHRYDEGWDVLRARRLERQKALGIIADDASLTRRDPSAPAWADVEAKQWQARRMEVYAAQVELMDRAIGRILDALDRHRIADDTIVMFLSDNGASAEEVPHVRGFRRFRIFTPTTRAGDPVELGNEPRIVPGPEDTYASYGPAWANLSNTPFRLFKKWVHEGGVAAPFIVRWPGGGVVPGGIVHTPHQLTHVVPTILDGIGMDHPDAVGGRPVLPLEGSSFLAELRGEEPGEVQPLFWEHCGNAAVREGDWKLVRRFREPWELYDLASDPTETVDVLAEHRARAEGMYERWSAWAERVGVRPFERIVDLYDVRGAGEAVAAR